MAFATTNVVRENNGSQNVIAGTWTATLGDTAGTFSVGGYVTTAQFLDNQTSGNPAQFTVPVNISNSSGTGTVTVYHHGTVTGGLFRITFK